MSINKVVYNSNTLMDATVLATGADDYAGASQILSGYSAMIKTGDVVCGTCTYDVDSTVIDSGKIAATAATMMTGTQAYVNGAKVSGTMVNSSGNIQVTANTLASGTTIPAGYHDGSGKAYVNDANLTATNIRSGITVLGVTGTMTGAESVTSQTKTVTPSASQQVVSPDTGYNYLSSVTVNAIPYAETSNTYGTTVTIG